MKLIRKTIVLVAGGLVLLLGIAMIVLPGPAVVLIPLGIAILSLEFRWAATALEWMKRTIRRLRSSGRRQ